MIVGNLVGDDLYVSIVGMLVGNIVVGVSVGNLVGSVLYGQVPQSVQSEPTSQ